MKSTEEILNTIIQADLLQLNNLFLSNTLNISKLSPQDILRIIYTNDIDKTQILLDNGLKLAKLNRKSKYIAQALEYGSEDFIEFLLNNGLSLKQLNNKIKYVIDLIDSLEIEEIAILLDHGLDYNKCLIAFLSSKKEPFWIRWLIKSGEVNFTKFTEEEIDKVIEIAFSNDEMDFIEYMKGFLSEFLPTRTLVGFSNIEGEWSENLVSSVGNLAGPLIIVPLKYELTYYDQYLEIFDAFINPGGGDSFPTDGQEFSLSYLSNQDNEPLPHEHAYQNVINFAKQHNKPYLGICNGAQHLILNEGGFVQVANKNTPKIILKPGSIVHFLAMNQEEQFKAFEFGIYPHIQFDISIQHSYAGVNDKLGNVELGGLSTTGVVEAVARNFYQIGLQFHPENKYQTDNRNFNLLNNILRIFIASKTSDIECIDKHLSLELELSFYQLSVTEQKKLTTNIYNFQDILQEAFDVCLL